MGVTVPGPESLEAFQDVACSAIDSARRLEVIHAQNDAFRRFHGRGRRPDVGRPGVDTWVDREGRTQMTADFGIRQLLILHGDLRRMVSAADVFTECTPSAGDPLSELREPLMQTTGVREVADHGPLLGPVHNNDTMIEILRSSLKASQKIFEAFFDLIEQRSVGDVDKIEWSETFAEVGLAAIHHSDETRLLLVELTNDRRFQSANRPIFPTIVREHLSMLEEYHKARSRFWEELEPSIFEDCPQLHTDIRHLLATRLLAPSVQVASLNGASQEAWKAYPWFSVLARNALQRLAMPEQAREQFTDFVKQRDTSLDEQQALYALLDLLMELWREDPRDLGARLQEGLGWETAGGYLNLIPSPYQGDCYPILVVVSLGDEFPHRLRMAHDYCIRCRRSTHPVSNPTRTIIFLTDRWDDAEFVNNRRSTFQALQEAYGVRLGVLLRIADTFTFKEVV